MIQDIIKDMQQVDLFVESCAAIHDGVPEAFDLSLELVRKEDNGDVYSYAYLTCDTCELVCEKRQLYRAADDRDLCSEVEYDNANNVLGYTQYRRATEFERMVFYDVYSNNKGYAKSVYGEWISALGIHPGSNFEDFYLNPFVPIIPDYVKQQQQ